MSPLNIHPEEAQPVSKKKSNKLIKVLLGISALIAVPVIGTTLAASITINPSPIQFGQGVAQATACDAEIIITPDAAFTNVTGAGSFKLGTITLTGIADACSGKVFKVRAYPDTEGALTISAEGTDNLACIATPTILSSAPGNSITSDSDCAPGIDGYSSDNNSITFTLAQSVNAADVYKFTLETL